jgi:hypothetical protein
MAADYVEILASETVTVELDAPGFEGLLVAIDGQQASTFPLSGNQASLDASQFEHLYLIVINPEQARYEYDCEFANYTVNVTSGGEPQSPTQTSQAPNFAVPQVEGLLDPEEYWGEDWEDWDEGWNNWDYETIEPPEELIPAYLPEGYEFIEAYLLEAEEYGPDAIWYIPGGETATVLDFYGPGEEDFIEITASQSPYTELDEWFEEAEFEPYDEERYTIQGIDVIIEDWSDDYGIYNIATFIHDEQFIVVEGTISLDEIESVVESLLE